jgi:hypothetical protein
LPASWLAGEICWPQGKGAPFGLKWNGGLLRGRVGRHPNASRRHAPRHLASTPVRVWGMSGRP